MFPAQRIFYICHNHDRPTGGQKHTYRHVDILNRNGLRAYAVHKRAQNRLCWFTNDTLVIDHARFFAMVDPLKDIVVVPEDFGYSSNSLPCQKVIFNKNVFLGFQSLTPYLDAPYPYALSDTIGALVVSEHNRLLLQHAFPSLYVERVFLDINPQTFTFCEFSSKRPQIVCSMKGHKSVLSLYHIVQSRSAQRLNSASAFNWIFLENETEAAVAKLLHDSALLICLSFEEGMGRLPLEAMASGCLLLTYTGGPLAATIPLEYQFQPGDLLSMVTFVETVMTTSFSSQRWSPLIQAGRTLSAEYTPRHQEQELMESWRRLLARASFLSDNTGAK